MKLMMKFCLCFHKITELWNLFSFALFRYYFRQLFMYLALRKCKNYCKILKISLVQIFVHLNLKLLDLLSDFVLNVFRPLYAWGILDLCLRKITVRKITWLSWRHRLRKFPFSAKCFRSTPKTQKTAFSSYFDLKVDFEKLRFRDGLVWTVGVTEEIKLRFQIIETTYRTVILCRMKHLCTVSANIQNRRQHTAHFT